MGAPQNNCIGSLAMAFKYCMSTEYKEYCERNIANCKTLSQELSRKGNKILTGGTDTNIMMWDIKQYGIAGADAMTLADALNIQF